MDFCKYSIRLYLQYEGGVTHDTSWTMLEAGKLQLGDFNSTAAQQRAGGSGPWSPQGKRPVRASSIFIQGHI